MRDDTGAIQSALDRAAAEGGGIVSLPAGQYAITRTLHIKPGVFLRGEGAKASSIIVSPIMPFKAGSGGGAGPYPREMPPMIWMETQSAVIDLNLVGGPGAASAIYVATRDRNSVSVDVSVLRTSIATPERVFGVDLSDYGGNQDLYGVWVASPSRNFTLAQCRFKCGQPLLMDMARAGHSGATITDNSFEVFPRQGTDNVLLRGINHAVIEDNDFIGGARALNFEQGAHNCWIFNNRVTDVGGWANSGESFMSLYGDALWDGACQAASADTIQAQGAKWSAGEFVDRADSIYVFVKLGKGFGQLRKVTANTADTVTLDAPWEIVPDSTSRFAVLPLTYHNLYINDQTVNCDGRCEFAYGSLVACVISGLNSRESEGISATAYGGGLVAFNDISYNRLIGLSGIRVQQGGEDKAPVGLLGNTIRYNEVMQFRDYPLNQYENYWASHGQPAGESSGIHVSGGSFNIVEDNYVTKGAIGVRIDGGSDNVVTRNRIDDVQTLIRDRGQDTLVVGSAH
jgi:parallel beta-helix repeat protein